MAALIVVVGINLYLLGARWRHSRRHGRGPARGSDPAGRARAGERLRVEASELAETFNEMLERLEREQDSRRRALAAQEGERLRIARELHDEIGQTLTARAAAARARMRQRAGRAPPSCGRRETAAETLEEARRISRELRPRRSTTSGWERARRARGRASASRPGCRSSRTSTATCRRSREAELVIYRVAQEALTNVGATLGRSDVELVLSACATGWYAARADNGRGITAADDGGGGMRGHARAGGADRRGAERGEPARAAPRSAAGCRRAGP